MQSVTHLDDPAIAALIDYVEAGTVAVPRAGVAPVLFETQGVAIQDVVLCGLAYERLVADAPSDTSVTHLEGATS